VVSHATHKAELKEGRGYIPSSVSAQGKYGRTFAKYARIFGFDSYLPKVLEYGGNRQRNNPLFSQTRFIDREMVDKLDKYVRINS
jgi:hypothetical protein